jgi:hypothetical protein
MAPVIAAQEPETSEERKSPNVSRALIGPAGESEDARMGREMVKAMFEEMMKGFQRAGVPMPGATATPTVPVMVWSFLFSKEEYEELGKPTPNEMITLTFALDRAAEPKLGQEQKAEGETNV